MYSAATHSPVPCRARARARVCVTACQQVAHSLHGATHAQLKRQTADAVVAVVRPIREEIARLLEDRRCSHVGALQFHATSRAHRSHIQNVLNEVTSLWLRLFAGTCKTFVNKIVGS